MKTKTVRSFYIVVALALILNSCGGALEPTETPPTSQPTSSPLQLEQGQLAPQVVARDPIEGQRLNLDGAIKITFDRDMDKEKTSQAFSLFDADNKTVTGKTSWVNARTFSFKPSQQLKPSTTYKAVFTDKAAGADGTSLQDVFYIKFMTVESLAVSQVFPADKTEDIDIGANITVIFNQPIVPLAIEEEQGTFPQPLVITPEIKGKGTWVNSSVYVFEPEKSLLSGTSYTVRIDAGLKDVTGKLLDESYSWKFTTRVPTIMNYMLVNGEWNPKGLIENVLLDQSFQITFNQPMDPESMKQSVTLTNRETGARFPIKLKWNKDSTELTIEPIGRYLIASFYDLVISDAALAANGGKLKEGLKLKFNTVPLPKIKSVYPEPNSQAKNYEGYVTIYFASPMNPDSLNSRVKVIPEPKEPLQFYYNPYDWSLNIYQLEPSTDYVVRILPGMTDIYGNSIASEISFAFSTAAMTPYANLVLPWTPLAFRAKGPQEVFFEHVNLDEATLSLYSLSFDEFKQMQGRGSQPTSFSPKNDPIREWSLSEPSARDTLNRLNIQLRDKQDNPLKPGYYFIGVRGEPLDYNSKFYQAYLFIVATDNITFKATDTEGLAWVVDLETGKPQANVEVTFYDEKYKELGKAKTNKDGVVYLKNINRPEYARAEGTDHVALAALDWGSGVWAGDFQINESYYSNTNQPFAYLYTDRPIYRPGQDVFFKGIVRKNDDLHYSLYGKKEVYVRVEHWGELVYEGTMTLSEVGSFTDSFKLDESAATGSYDISLRFKEGEDAFGFASFTVAEYHKPEFEVTAGADKSSVLNGATVSFSLDAIYYSGGNVVGADVNWYLEYSSFFFHPSGDYAQYSFSDWDRDTDRWESESSRNGTLSEGEAVTDENGHLVIPQNVSLGESKTSQVVTLHANVTDVAGNVVSGQTTVVIHQSEVYPGIRSEKYIGTEGEEQTFEVAVLDWDSKPVAGQTVSVKFVERQWFSVQEKDKQGQLRWVTSVKENAIGTQTAITDEKGLARLAFIPPKGGIYKAIVTTRDTKGNVQRASTYIWVAGDKYISWRQTNDRTFDLIADKASYAPGDTAEILIAQPFEGEVYALVTYERGHIYKQEVVLLNGSSTVYKIPISGDMAPVAYVSVTVISGAENTGRANFKIGMTTLNIETSEQTLDVSVTADKKSAGPGDEVTYTILTKDPQGKPISADVSLAIVDKAALALAPANSLPIVSAFYSNQSLSVRTAVGIVVNADDYNAQYRETIPEGESSGGGGGGEAGVITVRQNFKDTALFKGSITTNDEGRAQITVTLPENLTTWVADARAVTADSRMGQGSTELLSTKPLYVEMTTPRFFVVGDQAVIGATIHNNTDNALTAKVSLEAEGVTLKGDAAQSIEVPAHQQAYVSWEATVADVKRVDFTVHAKGGAFEDSSKPALGTLSGQGIPVYNYTVIETVGTSGMLLTANSATEGIQLPTTLNYEDAQLSIEVSPSLAASMQSGLTYLEQYPYYCIEQTISRFLPNVITMRALEQGGFSNPELKKNLDIQVYAALRKIYAEQKYDGGWSWWSADASDPLVTAYVVYGLIEAKDSGYPISDSALARGVEFLKDNLPILDKNEPTWKYNRQAFMMYALARGGKLSAGQTNYIYKNRVMLSLYGEAYLALTLNLLNPKDERIASIMSDFGTVSIMSSSGVHWEESTNDYYNWNTDLRTTAVVLNAFAQIDPTSPVTADAVRWLMAHRESGHWRSTQETTWTLIALTNWMIASKELNANYDFGIGLNGETIEQGHADKDNLTDTLTLQVQLKDLLKDEVNYLVFARGEGDGNLYYTAYLSTSLAVESVKPLDQGVSISREYFALDDPEHAVTEIARGEILRVRLTVIVPSSVHYIVIDDPLPAGFEAIDSSLNTSVDVPTNYTREVFRERGWGWWYFTHREIRDEKVVLSTDYLPAGTYVFTYLARASSVGTFKVIPPTASEFYFPDVGGRGAGSIFVVKP